MGKDPDSFYTPKALGRDVRLDMYRALMMIYVLCVIHVMFWLGKGAVVIKSLALFEMPVLFYISGAAMYVSGKSRGLGATFRNRAARVLLPYLFYILACLLFYMACRIVVPDLLDGSSVSVPRIILAFNHSVPIPYMFHLWFILPYFIVSCSFPIQRAWADKFGKWPFMAILLILYLLSLFFPDDYSWSIPLKEIMFYNLFFIAGYLFYKRLSLLNVIAMTACSGIAFLFLAIQDCAESGALLMHLHKFPPDLLFLAFGILSICLLSLIFGNIRIPGNRLLRRWNSCGFSIYLWQNFSFIIYSGLYKNIRMNWMENYPIADFLLAAVCIFILSTLTSLVIVPVENKFIYVLSAGFGIIRRRVIPNNR